MPALKRVFAACLLVLYYFLLAPDISAYFVDNFESNIDRDVWNVSENGGSVFSLDGYLFLSRSQFKSNKFPYVYSKADLFPKSGSFILEFSFQYINTGNFGDGIAISADSVPPVGTNPDSNLPKYMVFMAYQDGPNGLSYGKIMCNPNGTSCENREFLFPFTKTPDLNRHEITIEYTEIGQYKIYIDQRVSPNYISAPNQKRPKYIWLGNSFTTGSTDYWSSLKIDYFKITTVPNSIPIIFIPGFGASMDLPAILSGTAGSNWQIPEFVKVYDNLLNSLTQKGYTKDKDLFVFTYDWRKPLDDLADDLKKFIESKNLTEKVDFITHSMGGLVARTYAQKYGSEKINKIITAGTPHQGTMIAYDVWEGASVWGNIWWEKVLLETTTELNRKPGETKIDTLRRLAPSIKDLMPTYEYIYKEGSALPWSQMKHRNEYLRTLNLNSASIDQIIHPLLSKDEDTRDAVNVVKPSIYESLFGLWDDGKPSSQNPFSYVKGDGTVTENSAKHTFSNPLLGFGNHVNLLNRSDNLKAIFGKLGIPSDGVNDATTAEPSSVLIAALQSPGQIQICNSDETSCNPDGIVTLNNGKLVFLPGYKNERVKIKVLEDGTGQYKLSVGNINSNGQWESVTGKITKEDQVDTYYVEGSSLDLSSADGTAYSNLLLAKQRLNEVSPKWDKQKNVELLIDQNKKINSRQLSASILRSQLNSEFKSAKKIGDYKHFELALEAWRAIDLAMEVLLGDIQDTKKLKPSDLNYDKNALQEPKKNLSYFASALSELGADKLRESKELSDTKVWVKLDKLIQAEMLRKYALDIK